MEDIIRRIIAIEDKAQEIVNDAREAESNLDKRVESEDKRIAREIHDKAEARCRKMQEEERESVSGKIGQINARASEQFDGLMKKYSENKEKWVDDMVRHIIGE